ncbi:hypothetical protein [Vulgatibacter incomptus]|uniref:Lipoprotein n=1 Tax=Vulgatibacter incomptus TaxID=1391653 RepID=A0A0K1PF91_9BACT|nr:hypothetical protein [Vulgatibacter incomptus]AKU92091.1 hypothetical protein AKJ08_2478 [Vulgatibacter incomptus]
MRISSLFPILLQAALLAGCAKATPAAAPAATAHSEENPADAKHAAVDPRIRAPFVLRIEGPDEVKAGEVAKLSIHIAFSGSAQAPLELQVKVPPGIELIEGAVSETIDAGKLTDVVRYLAVRVDDPSAALEVTASMSGEDFGAHATKRHTFEGAPKPAERVRPGGSLVPLKK